MVDDTQQPQAPQQPQADAPAVHIGAQYVKDLSFENPGAPRVLISGVKQPQGNVRIDVRTNQVSGTTFEVVLTIKVDARSEEDSAYLVELVYGGLVETRNMTQEQAMPLLMVEVPRFLFPFARAIIAEATRNGGFQPLMLQPIDFASLYRRQMEQLRARQQQQAGGAETPPPSTVQ